MQIKNDTQSIFRSTYNQNIYLNMCLFLGLNCIISYMLNAVRSKKLLKKCNFCNNRVKFMTIEDTIGAEMKKYGFVYTLKDFETLNYKAFTCPSCGSSDRERLYKLFLENRIEKLKNSKVLDFAPSKIFEKYMREVSKEYRTADLLIDSYDDKVDITNMTKYKDNSFDFFICSHILEHVDNDISALKELYRVLKKDGEGIIMTPIIDKDGVQDEDISITDEAERWRRFAQYDHVRLYEKAVFLSRVKSVGFKVKEYTYKDLGIFNFLNNGISPKSKLYVVRRG